MSQERYREIFEEKALMSGGLRFGGEAIQGGAYIRCERSGQNTKPCNAAKTNPWLQYVYIESLKPENKNLTRKELLIQLGDNRQRYDDWKTNTQASDLINKPKGVLRVSKSPYATVVKPRRVIKHRAKK